MNHSSYKYLEGNAVEICHGLHFTWSSFFADALMTLWSSDSLSALKPGGCGF